MVKHCVYCDVETKFALQWRQTVFSPQHKLALYIHNADYSTVSAFSSCARPHSQCPLVRTTHIALHALPAAVFKLPSKFSSPKAGLRTLSKFVHNAAPPPPPNTKHSPNAQLLPSAAHPNCPLPITLPSSLPSGLPSYKPNFNRRTSGRSLGTVRPVNFLFLFVTINAVPLTRRTAYFSLFLSQCDSVTSPIIQRNVGREQ
jgi:hypothetical protein